MSGLCCVTAYFNPAGYQSRLRNYHIFADRLSDQGVRLVTVELAFGGAPFELPKAGGIVRVRSRSVLWQKERLLNHAIQFVPAGCDRVAWVDGDVLFPDRSWADRATEALDGCDVVQLFSHVRHLPPGATRPGGDATESDEGLVCQATGHPDWAARRRAGELLFAVPGYAWAARRAVLARAGLYDRLVLGSGDAFLADCLLGSAGAHHYWHARTPQMAADMDAWRARFSAAGPVRVGHVSGDVFHLWHGRFADRRYRERDGVLEWASDKPALHAEVFDYFRTRAEDAASNTPPPVP